jgi:hypothetical protein
MADVPLTLGSRSAPVPQLPASNSNSSQGLHRSSPLTSSVTHQSTRSTPLHSTELQLKALHFPPLHSLTNCPGYNISARTLQKTPFLCCCFNCCLLGICCLAADVVLLFVPRSLPNNGSIRHNTVIT